MDVLGVLGWVLAVGFFVWAMLHKEKNRLLVDEIARQKEHGDYVHKEYERLHTENTYLRNKLSGDPTCPG